MDPDALDSPPRLRQTLLLSFSFFFFCFFFVADTEPCAKEGFGAKNTENNTQHNNNSRSILWKRKKKEKGKQNIPLHVSTLFSLGRRRNPSKIKVPVCVHCRCTYCELQVEWTRRSVRGVRRTSGADGSRPRRADDKEINVKTTVAAHPSLAAVELARLSRPHVTTPPTTPPPPPPHTLLLLCMQ